MAGDGGLLMCTWPKGGKRDKWEDQWQFMYFNECMSGFEWQAASPMVYEGIDNPAEWFGSKQGHPRPVQCQAEESL